MTRPIVCTLLALFLLASCAEAQAPARSDAERCAEDALESAHPAETSTVTDWPSWRGPTHDGIAPANAKPPHSWSADENVIWKAPIPGRGHGSPIVFGEQVVLVTADLERDVQTVLSFERGTGKPLWKTDVHTGDVFRGGNKKASQASTTPACDGERIYVNLLNSDAVHTTALNLEGKRLWQRKISDYVVHQGYGSSPFLWEDLVLVAADNKGGGAICALARATGDVVWRHERPKKPNYPSPVVYRIDGREQLILTGCDLVTSLAPRSGDVLWEMEGATTECVTTTVTDGERIITSGGYPTNHVSAIEADGSKKIAWKNGVRVYVPSMVCVDGWLYAVTDAGVATCWQSSTGETAWKGRLGGTFSSSLVLADGHLFATNERGRTFIFEANPEEFVQVATNELGDEVLATPAMCGSRIWHRVAEKQVAEKQVAEKQVAEKQVAEKQAVDDKGDRVRQEMLYCIGER